jgi:CubicO group peptidase (beta-lactamase class C family)
VRSRVDIDDLAARIDADLVRLRDQEGVPGASVVLTSGSRVVEATVGVINTRTRVPVTADTIFQIQSVTKIFTATLVMQLVDEGLISLDDPVQAHLPEFCTADPAASEQITVRHLLTHTGGFEGDLWQPTTSGGDALDRFVRDLVSQATQYSPPGQRFSYCSAGFGTLGRLVEVQRCTTYEDALRRHLAEPLGIDELAFCADQALAFRAAIGHVRPAPDAPLRPTRHWALMPPSNPAAGNQLAMSARSLARLGQMFVSRGRAVSGVEVLSAASVATMLQPQLRHRDNAPSPIDQGLGWWLPKPGVAEHGGGAPGTVAMLTIVPDQQLTVVVLTNADEGARLTRLLLDPLLSDVAQVPPTPALPVPDTHTRVADPTAYQGQYANRQTGIDIDVDSDGRLWQTKRLQNDELVMAHRAGFQATSDRYELRPIGFHTFVRISSTGRGAGTIAFFDPDANGRFTVVADDRVASRRA